MSDLYIYLLANVVDETAPFTFKASDLELVAVEPSVVPPAVMSSRYPYAELSFFAIDDGRYSLVGQQWMLLKWFISKHSAKLHAANERGRLRMELGWLADLRAIPNAHLNLDRLIKEAQEERDEIRASLYTMRQRINDDLDVVRAKRNQRITKDYRSGIPKFNALTTAITYALLQDLSGNIETVRGIVDRPQPNPLTLNGMQVSVLGQIADGRSREAQAKIRKYFKIKHESFSMKRKIDVLRWNDTLLGNEIDLWHHATSGLLTACGSLHFSDSSDSDSESTEDTEAEDIDDEH
ncbi:hypothetical protein CALCODRAFT_510495 [Calocera cornea HHB12733]|uniref:Uncharacterized protein n=1 Tax=Calocera cornea HHB12733 TaxID=1353952 RepID=A0A165EGM9_9BASI|nr:hypothetical protein CALCODRAFT_510495 [Calocera cornea HHB12733]